MGFFRRVLEGLFINVIWLIIQTVIASAAIIVIAVRPDIRQNLIVYPLLIFAAEIIVFVIWYFRRRYYPTFNWDIIHGKNTYTLTYYNREHAAYEKKIEAIAMRKTLDVIQGECRWTGDSCGLSVKEVDDFSFESVKAGDMTEYTVRPTAMIFKPYRHLNYTIEAELSDNSHTAEPSNFIYIIRPAKKITLILKMPESVPVHNVRYLARTKYGEENVFIKKKGKGVTENGYDMYTFRITNPKLFCEYEISWDWYA